MKTPHRYDRKDAVQETKEGRKHDSDKVDFTLLEYSALQGACRVLEFGAQKYERDNWKQIKDPQRFLKALLRHAHALSDGEMIDQESGVNHIHHLICEAMFYSYATEQGKDPGAIEPKKGTNK